MLYLVLYCMYSIYDPLQASRVPMVRDEICFFEGGEVIDRASVSAGNSHTISHSVSYPSSSSSTTAVSTGDDFYAVNSNSSQYITFDHSCVTSPAASGQQQLGHSSALSTPTNMNSNNRGPRQARRQRETSKRPMTSVTGGTGDGRSYHQYSKEGDEENY
jgi:CCR4-NOT transcriptional regulation complex NOT5 subunit